MQKLHFYNLVPRRALSLLCLPCWLGRWLGHVINQKMGGKKHLLGGRGCRVFDCYRDKLCAWVKF